MSEKIPREKWIWMPHPAHLIVGQDCRFHLATAIGEHIVSTVGEYLPDSSVREIFAKSRCIRLEGIGDARRADWMKKNGFEDIGFNRKYETMVFASQICTDCPACPYRQLDGDSLDMSGYNDAGEAFRGHLDMCEKWSAIITEPAMG